MKVGATKTDILAVKRAFESTYKDMGISCDQIGGLWSDGEREYFDGMDPCEDAVDTVTPVVVTESNNSLEYSLTTAHRSPCTWPWRHAPTTT